MKGSKTLFSLQNSYGYAKEFLREFTENLGTRPRCSSPALS